MVNQGLSSGISLFVNLYAIYVLSKEDYGLFGMLMFVVMFVSGLIASSISVQYAVNVVDVAENKRPEFVFNNLFLVLILGTILLLCGGIFNIIALSTTGIGDVGIVVMSASAAYILREYLAQVLYSQKNEIPVLLGTSAMAASVLGIYLILYVLAMPVSERVVLYAFTLGQLVSALLMCRLIRIRPRSINTDVLVVLRASWKHGKWNIMSSLLYNVRTQIHSIIIGPTVGLAALAEINAARILVAPAIMLMPAIKQVLLPRLAEMKKTGSKHLYDGVKYSVITMSALAAIYITCLWMVMPFVNDLMLEKGYDHILSIAWAWSMVVLVLSVKNGITCLLQVLKRFKELFYANLIASLISATLGVALALVAPFYTIVYAILVAEVVLCIFLLRLTTSVSGRF